MSLDALARPSGTFAMVAMDQRESLRTMLREHGHDDGDERVARFKSAVARELAPHASGFVIEREHVDAVAPLDPHGLILAVGRRGQGRGRAGWVTLRRRDGVPPAGVVGLKLLVIWRDDERRPQRVELAGRFVALAARHGLLSVLEPVVRVPEERREDAIVEAARELGAVRPSLYKCQVPLGGRGDPDEIARHASRIDEALPCPWVVLSQGVDPGVFPRAVEASCRGGASGFLAGRALWTGAVAADDPTELLRVRSVPRLRELAEIVDAHGRPWREKGGAG